MKLDDGNKAAEKREAHLANTQVHTFTKRNTDSVIEAQVKEMSSKVESLDKGDVEGKPMGSRWKIVSIDKLGVDIVET